MREFNTSGPNNPEYHYTLLREELINKGLKLVEKNRYFTIWAPRQTGKSTYFLLLSEQLRKRGYKVAVTSFENMEDATEQDILALLDIDLSQGWGIELKVSRLIDFYLKLRRINSQKCVLVIDEIEGLNEKIFGKFLHTLRSLYHFRSGHCLKSVILVGVANITGVVQDNASPFNIADSLEIPYFTREEVWELLGQHEQETGQRFAPEVKDKVYQITAGQPGLVNGFAWKMVTDYPGVPELTLEHYYKVEDWYSRKAIDKNIANILNKASQYREFIERLLFKEADIDFQIDRPAIKFLYVNGLIKDGKDGKVEFWVPLYKKRVYAAFYPYSNGEEEQIKGSVNTDKFLTADGKLNLEYLIKSYKSYVKRRGFRPFLERDESGKVIGIKESALLYSFETYINAVVEELGGKIYREADTGLGKSDIIINLGSKEYVIESKVYYSPSKFERGKRQLAYYCKSVGVDEGTYLVFVPSKWNLPPTIKESVEEIEGVKVRTYLVWYDEEKDF